MTLVVGIAVVGVALMFGKGSAWVSAIGADRVAAGLAQQRIEQIRACGWDKATFVLPPNDGDIPPDKRCPEANPSSKGQVVGVERPITDWPVDALGKDVPAGEVGLGHTFSRTACIQYVDPTTREGLTQPAYAPDVCPAGPATSMIRVTVVVTSGQPEASPVTLQAWMSQIGP